MEGEDHADCGMWSAFDVAGDVGHRRSFDETRSARTRDEVIESSSSTSALVANPRSGQEAIPSHGLRPTVLQDTRIDERREGDSPVRQPATRDAGAKTTSAKGIPSLATDNGEPALIAESLT
jgi:hypothetical protein